MAEYRQRSNGGDRSGKRPNQHQACDATDEKRRKMKAVTCKVAVHDEFAAKLLFRSDLSCVGCPLPCRSKAGDL
jgi:hypothetical protein